VPRRPAFSRLAVALGVVLLVLGSACGGSGAGASARLVDVGLGLKGPAGTKASMYAQGLPNVGALAFDEQGRLWVATAAFDDTGTDAVYVVNQSGTTPIEVLPDQHTPLGLVWVGDSLYVAGKGGVVAYSGFDGTAFAAHKTVVPLEIDVGEVNALVLGPDGRLHLGISSPCDHCTPTNKQSASVLSFLPDGTDVRIDTTGIRAPIGLAYYPGTSDLFVTMNQRDDLGDKTPGDWLAVVAAGQHWRFPDCYGQAGSVCEGVPAPVATLGKHSAVSGVAIVTGQLGPTVGNAAIVAEWATGDIERVALSKTDAAKTDAGTPNAGYTGTVSTFVTGIQKPVPVILGPDGSVLIGDWGTGTIYSIRAA
jgi:glucose/arabinose dehydrogenase